MFSGDVGAAHTLIENIARFNFGADWHVVISETDISSLHSDSENKVIVARVNNYTNLEILGETATSEFGFVIDKNLIHISDVVTGTPHGTWKITRTWWFDLEGTEEPAIMGIGNTPKGVPLRFMYSESRTTDY